MARVAVLIDRAPACPDWKGGVAWALINALAESQHDLQIFTPLPPEQIPTAHARVGVASPAPSFGLPTLARWGRALAQYRPDVVHTIAPRPSAQWPKLTCWPYFEALGPLLPHARRVATTFEDADFGDPARGWLLSHLRTTSFAADRALADLLPRSAADQPDFDDGEILIPAPVSEWSDLPTSLARLSVFLRDDPTRRVRIVGGWGDLPLPTRRRTWTALVDFTARVRLSEPLGLADFVRDARHARGLWTECLRPDSWRARVSTCVNEADLPAGDVVNHLSRIYSAPGRW